MAKKLFVPERMTKPKDEMPPAIEKAFDQHDEDTKNNEDPSKMEASALERLPQPVGYRLLVIPYYMKAKTSSGVYIPDKVRERESFATVAAYVVKVGPDAYKDAQKFPTGPWCEQVLGFNGRYAGNRFSGWFRGPPHK